MAFRDEVEAARAKIASLEHRLAELDRTLAELDEQIAVRDAALAAQLPTERHRIRLRQLQAAITQAEQETAALRLRRPAVAAASERRR